MSAVLNNLHNNYLTTYSPKSMTRYDAHKRANFVVCTIPLSN